MLNAVTLSLALLASGAPAAPVSAHCPAIDAPLVLPVSIGEIGAAAVCTATAECAVRPDVSCEDNSNPADCHSVDTDCSTGTIGYVECGGSRTYCSSDSCSSCSQTCCGGDRRHVSTSLCCSADPFPERAWREEQCVNGGWEFVQFICLADTTCGGLGV